MLTPDFSKREDLDRYEAFMEKLVELVLDKYDGSLKAEHGTGINMAPYVEREWGSKATELMWRVKVLADPDGVLSPGVLLNRDPGVHVRNLKTTPPIEEVATNCVECGFCEPVCPSRHLTLTPRQRIVVRREMARQPKDSPVRSALLEQYEYEGLETCAADGSCAPACPLAINTGELVKGLRARQHDERAERRAAGLARRWRRVDPRARGPTRWRPARGLPGRAGARLARTLVSDELAPDFPPQMPQAASGKLPATSRDGAAAVYMPACVNRIFGRPRGASRGPSLPEAMVEPRPGPASRSGSPRTRRALLRSPLELEGFKLGHELMANSTVEAMWGWSGEGELPIVIDASSCSLGLRDEVSPALTDENRERHAELTLLDSVAWAHDRLRPPCGRLRSSARSRSIRPARPATSGSAPAEALGDAIAEDVFVPIRATCCGMAGDRGMLHPELTQSATEDEAGRTIAGRAAEAYLCSNRTCEIGLHQATGHPFESVLIALESATRSPATLRRNVPSGGGEAVLTAPPHRAAPLS